MCSTSVIIPDKEILVLAGQWKGGCVVSVVDFLVITLDFST